MIALAVAILQRYIIMCVLISFPELTFQKMTVGKIYAGLLIAENWKAYKASQSKMGSKMMVSRP